MKQASMAVINKMAMLKEPRQDQDSKTPIRGRDSETPTKGDAHTKFLGLQLRTWTGLAALFTILGVVVGTAVPLVLKGHGQSSSGANTTPAVSPSQLPPLPTSAPLGDLLPASGPAAAVASLPVFSNTLQAAAPAPILLLTPSSPESATTLSPEPARTNITGSYCFDGALWCASTDNCKNNFTKFINLTECCGALDISRNVCLNKSTSAFPSCDNTMIGTYGATRRTTILYCKSDGCKYESCKTEFSDYSSSECNPLSPSGVRSSGAHSDLYTCCLTYSTSMNNCVTDPSKVFSYCKLIGFNYTKCK